MLNKMRKFIKNNPWIIIVVDKVDTLYLKALPAFVVFLSVVLVGFPSICVYFALDKESRDTITPIISSVFSLIVVPLILNYVNKIKQDNQRLFQKNEKLYQEITDILVGLLANKETYETQKNKLDEFYYSNYSHMCINCSNRFIGDLEMLIKAHNDKLYNNVRYYSSKIIKYIRLQNGINGSFYLRSIFSKTN